jgi:hypothetical protein
MLGDAKGDVVWVMTCCYDYDLIMTMAVVACEFEETNLNSDLSRFHHLKCPFDELSSPLNVGINIFRFEFPFSIHILKQREWELLNSILRRIRYRAIECVSFEFWRQRETAREVKIHSAQPKNIL